MDSTRSAEVAAAMGTDVPGLFSMAAQRDFRPQDTGFRVTARIETSFERVQTYNVAGMVRGSDPALAGEFVVDASVDAAQARFSASGWFGGFEAQNDRAVLRYEFLSASDAVLGMGSLGGVTDTDRADTTSLLSRSATGPVPAQTRKVRFVLESIHDEGMAVDGYADDLFFSVE
jgi:hypothetical protein